MLTVTINAVDKTNAINWRDFTIERNLTKEPDICLFSVNYVAGGYKPSINQEIIVENDSVRIFAGTIIEVNDRLVGGRGEVAECVAKDYTFVLDRKLVTTTYANKTADYIIKDIIDNFTTGFTYANVASGAGVVKNIKFNYESPSKAIQKIADMFDWDWYVDYNKDIHFFKSTTLASPFELDETDTESFIGESLNIKQDLTQIRNSVYVRGGDQSYSLTSTNAEKYVADGQQTVFVIGHKFLADTSFAVEKSTDGGANWTPLSEGAFGTDDPASYDILYDPNKRAVIFREDNKPANGNYVRVFGSYTLPVIVYRTDEASIALYGEFQFRIIDNSITSKDEASQKAKAELRKYAEKANTGGFKTYKDGLDVGQWVTINLPTLGLSGSHKIQKMRISVVEPSTPKFLYDCVTVASEIVGSIDILSKLLISNPNQNIVIEDNEVVDKIYGFEETIALAESFVATVYPSGSAEFSEVMAMSENNRVNPWGVDVEPIWVAGDASGNYYPTSGSDEKRVPMIDAALTVQ